MNIDPEQNHGQSAHSYVIWHNATSRFMRGYEGRDNLVRGYEGKLPIFGSDTDTSVLERVFTRHNRDDRPDGQQAPSLSVGDVVVLNGHYSYTCQSAGWERVDISFASGLTVPSEGQTTMDVLMARMQEEA